MEAVVIADIHCRTIWKEIVAAHEERHIVFLGDYCDPYSYVPHESVMRNLMDIVIFKRKNPHRVTLLLGNHDVHYAWDEAVPCTRYDSVLAPAIKNVFESFADDFQVAWQVGSTLLTHAGVTPSWLKTARIQASPLSLGEVLNDMSRTEHGRTLLSLIGESRGGMRGDPGGPMWADFEESYQAASAIDLVQYVGHSKVERVVKTTMDGHPGSITYCDVLHRLDSGGDINMEHDVPVVIL